MTPKQHTFHSITIEVVIVLLASIISFPLSDIIGVKLNIFPFVVVVCYVAFKLLYHLCLSLSACIINSGLLLSQTPMQFKQQLEDNHTSKDVLSTMNDNDILIKRMELFHYEYQHEQEQYLLQKGREADEKLCAVLKYTRNTFKRLDFDEDEVSQICECVRYFVTNKQLLTATEIHIKKRTPVTQISLKNFAWNIAFQYDISRDITAQFVMQTFNEWFSNSTIDTIRKNLRTTAGRHKIEIDENIISG